MDTPNPGDDGAAQIRFVTAAQLRELLPIPVAADALAHGFLARDPAQMDGVARSVLEVPGRPPGDPAEVLLMPAFGPEGAGLKLVSIVRGNAARGLPLIQGMYVLLSEDGMTPELAIDGAAMTGVRTAAVSALATRCLARRDSRRLVVFGAGAQAEAHVEAMRAVLPIEHVTVVGSTVDSPRAAALAARLRGRGIDCEAGGPEAVGAADVICACTTSTAPIFDDRTLPPGVHINAIGAYRLDMAEIPAATLARALLVVESVEATLSEAGDVVAAIRAGALPQHGFAALLGEVIQGKVSRSSAEQITVFKSVGLSSEDLIVARAVAEALRTAT